MHMVSPPEFDENQQKEIYNVNCILLWNQRTTNSALHFSSIRLLKQVQPRKSLEYSALGHAGRWCLVFQPATNRGRATSCEKRLRGHARIAVKTAPPHSPQLQNLLWTLPVLAQERAQLISMKRTRRPSCGGVRTKYSSSRGLPTHPLGPPFVVVQERRAASQMRGDETMLFVVVPTNLPYLHPQSLQVVVLAPSSSSSVRQSQFLARQERMAQ
jgi:hypothetical protein